jgi:hypothetical protein
LWSLLAALFEEGRGFKKAEGFIKSRHGANWPALVCLYLPTQPPALVL